MVIRFHVGWFIGMSRHIRMTPLGAWVQEENTALRDELRESSENNLRHWDAGDAGLEMC